MTAPRLRGPGEPEGQPESGYSRANQRHTLRAEARTTPRAQTLERCFSKGFRSCCLLDNHQCRPAVNGLATSERAIPRLMSSGGFRPQAQTVIKEGQGRV